jgi:hypothetical protein
MSRQSIRKVQREYSVAALRGPVLYNIFPLLAVFVFLFFVPGIAGCEIKGR